MEHLSEYIANFYLKKRIIDEDEKNVYKYAANLILNEILTFLIVLLIATVFFKTIYAFEFLVTFCLTRIYCGGFHANSVFVCRSTMIVTCILTIKISSLITKLNFEIYLAIIILGLLILLPIIPVKHAYKRLNREQIRQNRIRGVLIYLFFSIVSCFMWNGDIKQEGIIIGLSLGAVAVLAIIGIITNGRCKYE